MSRLFPVYALIRVRVRFKPRVLSHYPVLTYWRIVPSPSLISCLEGSGALHASISVESRVIRGWGQTLNKEIVRDLHVFTSLSSILLVSFPIPVLLSRSRSPFCFVFVFPHSRSLISRCFCFSFAFSCSHSLIPVLSFPFSFPVPRCPPA